MVNGYDLRGNNSAVSFFYTLLKEELLLYSLDIRQSFSFQNNAKNLDPSYKMDLDIWECLGRVKLIL